MSEPIISEGLFNKAMGMGEEMRAAIINPNTDFMTKLLFDARFLAKKTGKPHTHWSQAIFGLKMLLMEKPGRFSESEIAEGLGLPEKDIAEVTAYLLPMAEVKKEAGKFSLNLQNAFSRMFREN